jgi:FkbM family methyltransferase
MIIFNNVTENNDGLSFTSLFESKWIRVKVIDSYTGLVAWQNDMYVGIGEHFLQHPIRVKHCGFEISDRDTGEIYLRINICNEGYQSMELLDPLQKLKDFKYSEKSEDIWSAYSLYEIFINNCYDKPNCGVEPGDVVFDIGANIGLFSYYSALKGASRVYAFEPGKAQSDAIRDNFQSLGNLVIERKAVFDENRLLEFNRHKTKSMLSGFFTDADENEYETVECPGVNLMDYCRDKGIARINFLKMDCEGSEYKIFSSLTDEFIKSIGKISMEYHDNSDGRVRPLIARLERNGFTVNVPDPTVDIGLLTAYR